MCRNEVPEVFFIITIDYELAKRRPYGAINRVNDWDLVTVWAKEKYEHIKMKKIPTRLELRLNMSLEQRRDFFQRRHGGQQRCHHCRVIK